jgi:cytochrome c peroxidase
MTADNSQEPRDDSRPRLRSRVFLLSWLIAAVVWSIMLGVVFELRRATPDARAATAVTPAEALSAARALAADPLAQPRSLAQTGVPLEATRAAIPAANPQTPEKIALGQKLFFDPRLSADGTVACSTCHDPRLAFTDHKPASVGIHGRIGQRNSPTILNALYNKTQFWDGRAATLEDQAGQPIVNPSEMGRPNLDAAVAGIAAIAEYRQAFNRVFGRAPNATDLVRAISSYERTLVSYDSPFDRFIAGDDTAIDASAKRGWALFNTQGRCNKCHALTDTAPDTTNFMDNDFHNIGIGIIRHNVVALARQAGRLINSADAGAIDRAAIETDMSALGRFLITKKEADIASFKTPDLRNVLVTGPYFHDGSQDTLWDVVDHYNKGDGMVDPYLDDDIQPLAMTEDQIDDLVAFMAALTSLAYQQQGVAEFARQRAVAQKVRPQRDTARAFGPKPPRPIPPKP